MKLKLLLKPILTWWWMIALASIIAGVTTFFIVRQLPKVYSARTMLMVSSTINDPNPEVYQFNITSQLAQTYAYIGYQDTVRNATMQALNLPDLPDYEVTALTGGFLEITVTDINPVYAAEVANELAHQLINISPTNLEQSQQAQLNDFVQTQLVDLQVKISRTQEEIAAKEADLSDATSASEISQIQNDIVALETKLTNYQTTYASLLTTTGSSAINTISVFEPASVPRYPIGPKILLVVLIAVAGGFVLSTAGAYIIEYLDDSIKEINEISELIEAPIIAAITQLPKEKGWDYLKQNPDSAVADSFHMLNVNLGFMGIDHPIHTILITSPGPADGKSTIAINLAYTMAKGNKSVVIVDADLRRPSLHTTMGVSNDLGLSRLFIEDIELKEVLQPINDGKIFLIASGDPPPNPTDLLGSSRMELILDELKHLFDVVIIDCPPMLVPDTSVLSKKVDGVLLVVRPSHTTRRTIQLARDQLRRAGARILGVVANGVSAQTHYYGGYYHSRSTEKSDRKKRKPAAPSS